MGEEEDNRPRSVSFTGHRPSGAEFSAVPTRWGEDSVEGSVRGTLVPSTFGGTDHEDVEIGAVCHGPGPTSSGNDSSNGDNDVSVPVPLTRWGDESDNSDDQNVEGGARLVTSPRPSSVLTPAVNADEHAEEGRWSRDEQEQSREGLRQQEEHVAASWGSDDGDDTFDFRPSDFSQPFRMGAAAGVTSIGARSSPLPASVTHTTASWGCDGEEGDDSGIDDFYSPTIPTQADVNAERLSPVRHHRHHHRGDSDEVVVAPWSPYARGRSGLGDEPNNSWADESEGDEDASPRRTDNLNRILMGGAHIPARNATLPAAFDDIDIATDDETFPRDDGRLAATCPEQASTPSTAAPSPWFGALGRHFRRKSASAARGGEDDDGRYYPWNLQPTTTPSHGDPLLGRWPRQSAPTPPHPINLATPESSPMHEAIAQGDSHELKTSAVAPVQARRRWFRRKKAKEVGPTGAREGKDGDKGDVGSGVRKWGWRDRLKSAPGLVGRLAVCILAVCALWLTSLSVVGEW